MERQHTERNSMAILHKVIQQNIVIQTTLNHKNGAPTEDAFATEDNSRTAASARATTRIINMLYYARVLEPPSNEMNHGKV